MEDDTTKIIEDSDADTSDDIESENNDMEMEVEDTDADTRDVERESSVEFRALIDRLENLERLVETIDGAIKSIRDAQSVLIDNGAIIHDDTEPDDVDDLDDFRSISELDLTL